MAEWLLSNSGVFMQAVREALMVAELEAVNYAGHSFRIGAATTAA